MNDNKKEDIEAIKNLALRNIRIKLECACIFNNMTEKYSISSSKEFALTSDEYMILFSECFNNKEIK